MTSSGAHWAGPRASEWARLGVGVVGAGPWGSTWVAAVEAASLPRHGEARGPRPSLAWVCDPSPSARAALAERHPHALAIAEVGQALALPSTSVVIVATSAPSHFDIARSALVAGRHVLVEKPLALAASEAAELVSLAEQRGLVLMAGHVSLFHPAIEALVASVREGLVGEVAYVRTHRANHGRVRTDESAWWSLAPHDLAVVLELFDASPIEVSAQGVRVAAEGLDDLVSATLRFSGGPGSRERHAHVHVSRVDATKRRTTTVVGSKAIAEVDELAHTLTLRPLPSAEPRPGSAPRVTTFERVDLLQRELAELLGAVHHRSTPRSCGRLGLRVVRALEACERSLRSGRAERVGGDERGHAG